MTPGRRSTVGRRFIVTNTLGLLITVVVCAASMQDRDGAKPVLLQAYLVSRVRFVFADAAFAGRLLEWAARSCARRSTSCASRVASAGSR
ncbi:MAG: hypothetical protein ICV72_14340 [Aldersonia sp.]|nr:hypothetical protein [Aldersonia sp.]